MVATQQNSNPLKAITVAKYFIRKNKEDGKGLDKLKLQKLLYYAQVWNLVMNKAPFIYCCSVIPPSSRTKLKNETTSSYPNC